MALPVEVDRGIATWPSPGLGRAPSSESEAMSGERQRPTISSDAGEAGRPRGCKPPRLDVSGADVTDALKSERGTGAAARRRFLAPLALAQFICSFAGSNMNVMINDITHDLDTTVTG